LESTFATRCVRGLQATGQTLFPIRYEDINDVEVLNGLAAFLGSEHRLSAASQRLKRQNPGKIEDKVANVRDMTAALARIDRFGLDRITDGEVPRPAGASGFVAHPEARLLLHSRGRRSGRASARLDVRASAVSGGTRF
jgi:hypothetical protein